MNTTSNWLKSAAAAVETLFAETEPSKIDISKIVVPVLAAQLFVLIYFQKFGVLVSEDFQISVPLIFTFGSLVWLAIRGAIRFESGRILLFSIFIASATLSQSLGALYISYTSFSILVLLYLTFTLNWSVNRDQLCWISSRFSAFMIVPALLVLVQFAYQLYFGEGNSLSLDNYVPRSFLLSGYVYESSTETWITWNRPNGLVFLEPSFCSAYLACALILELQSVRSAFRMALFVTALLATGGATGFLMLAIATPIIAFKKSPSITIVAASIALFGLLLASTINLNLSGISRLSELSDPSSSGYGRLLLPFQTLLSLMVDPHFLISGKGAGQITADFGSAWPITKLCYEYGVLTAVAYFIFCAVSMYSRTNTPLSLALFAVFQFTGGYLLSPFLVLLVFLTCTSLTPNQPEINNR